MRYDSNVRLSNRDLDIIKQAFIKHFQKTDHLWLFGSRVDLNKRGGDIDLYIETTYNDVPKAVSSKVAFYTEMQYLLGEQRIDIVLNMINSNYVLPIYEVAKQDGVMLV